MGTRFFCHIFLLNKFVLVEMTTINSIWLIQMCLRKTKMSLFPVTTAEDKHQLITDYLKFESKLTMNYFLNLNVNIILRHIDLDI